VPDESFEVIEIGSYRQVVYKAVFKAQSFEYEGYIYSGIDSLIEALPLNCWINKTTCGPRGNIGEVNSITVSGQRVD
jgi:hypothetical protein